MAKGHFKTEIATEIGQKTQTLGSWRDSSKVKSPYLLFQRNQFWFHSQTPVTLVKESPSPSSGLQKHCMHVYKPKHRYTYINIFFYILETRKFKHSCVQGGTGSNQTRPITNYKVICRIPENIDFLYNCKWNSGEIQIHLKSWNQYQYEKNPQITSNHQRPVVFWRMYIS